MRIWYVAGNFALPLIEITAREMKELTSGKTRRTVSGYPIYWSKGLGVWPDYAGKGVLVRETQEQDL